MSCAYTFPEGFLWGCATASYQIEGAVEADGRGPSIWDELERRPGAIFNGDTAAVACDHYHRLDEDLDLIRDLGVGAYRFSFAWPRIHPEGRGPVNAKGLDFYDRLIDGLLARGVEPAATLYHWDLPLALEKEGGWRVRSTAEAFEGYARTVYERFGDRVSQWFTLNEPLCVIAGYNGGGFAPGAKEDEQTVRQVLHHLYLGHGLAVRAGRALLPEGARLGVVLNFILAHPFTEDAVDVRLSREHFHQHNAWYVDPILNGRYPKTQWDALGGDVPEVASGDMDLISAPLDFLGVNQYNAQDVARAGAGIRPFERGFPRTSYDWPITPDALYWVLRHLKEGWNVPDLYVTENGRACDDDTRDDSGLVEDYARVHFLRDYLRGVHRALDEGLPVKGYFVWSLLDNFEWMHGYSQRFGLVHVDFETLERTRKLSFEWFKRAVARNGF